MRKELYIQNLISQIYKWYIYKYISCKNVDSLAKYERTYIRGMMSYGSICLYVGYVCSTMCCYICGW